MTVHQLLDGMSSEELTEWAEVFAIRAHERELEEAQAKMKASLNNRGVS